ncbi:hypothetical protein H634G_11193 [Metarhizium anisopliae BRIP 53293]|uniref:Protein kinase domain-containing protein n=1 Tax=Metarhizium anisopliae BRIP 53293 TaxID=1291518 RepID=A0A0D9NHS9_METAN|nr:hypothetical protein H634G_11193 [Metarhizium anisopliae BRIP 53293]
MGDAPEFDDIRVVHINAGNDEGADITIEINSKRITVSLFANSSWQGEGNSQLGTTIEDQLIQLLNQAVTAADEEYDDLINRALDTILDIGGPAFSKVAPPMCDSSQSASPDLHSHLYPDALDFRLQTIDGKVAIFQIDPDEAISLPDAAPDPRFPTKIWKYNLSSDSTIRVPRLRGYVKHAYSGAIIGLLRDWVPSGSHGNTLRDIDVCAVSPDLRRRWAAQIRQTVSRLHAIGVIWGDGKASNVIVDKNDDVWLIDLAGGWSRGWVDEDLADTVEGDDQAVARIVKFLDL